VYRSSRTQNLRAILSKVVPGCTATYLQVMSAITNAGYPVFIMVREREVDTLTDDGD
jgi:hypothetical protein